MGSSRHVRTHALAILPLLALGCGPGADPPAATAALTAGASPLVVVVPAPTRPVPTTDGKQHLLYELVLENAASAGAKLEAIEVLGDGRVPLARYAGDDLAAIVVFIEDDGTGTLAPGQQAVVFIDLALASGRSPPRWLVTRISTTSDGAGAAVSTTTVDVVDQRPVHLGPPLRGGDLIDLAGCCTSDHTRALLAFPDGLFLAQRYAIDFVRVDVAAALAGGDPLAHGDPTLNESYLTFGNEIIAVTDGRIADVRDGMPENVPNVVPPPSVATAAGNYVVEALDDGRFALYAHVQPGSLRVHPGQRVRRGDVLALVGNTGNSMMPHLHFHVMDRAAPLDANGLPYVFDHFDLEATVDVDADAPLPTFTVGPQLRRDLLPMTGDLIRFP
jgi:hypothetical protein